MAAGTVTFYNSFREFVGDGSIDLDTDSFKIGLLTSTYSPNVSTEDAWADISTNEITAGNGYTAGGDALASVTWTRSGGTVTFTATNHVWTASGGSIPAAKWAVIYDDTATTPSADLLVCYIDLNTDSGSATVGPVNDGSTLTIDFPSGGIFTFT